MILCDKLSDADIEIGLVPVGSLGMSLFAILVFLEGATIPEGMVLSSYLSLKDFLLRFEHHRILFYFTGMALFGGLYIVPLYALVQSRGDKKVLSRIIAANNILNSFFMVLGALAIIVAFHFQLTIPQIFLAVALLNICVAIYIYTLIPEFLIRFIVYILVHFIYRLEVQGKEHIPKEGAAILVCNHVSFVDGLIVQSVVSRLVRFVIYHKFVKMPLIGYVFRKGKWIPDCREKRGSRPPRACYGFCQQCPTKWGTCVSFS